MQRSGSVESERRFEAQELADIYSLKLTGSPKGWSSGKILDAQAAESDL